MNIAIYSRKSKFTETGDSIKNQKNICRNYAKQYFSDCNFIEYGDEGYSGGNIERPMFKKLINNIEQDKINALICYRLDRISRNINDFSATLRLLDKHNITFISVTEQFDTTNPMGTAMMYIASVFVQLERDTIAQRITDNFTELSKTGQYLMGTPPEGFKKKKVFTVNKNIIIFLKLCLTKRKKSDLFTNYILTGKVCLKLRDTVFKTK